MVAAARAAVRRNSTRRVVVSGDGRQNVWEYADEAVGRSCLLGIGVGVLHTTVHGIPCSALRYSWALREFVG